MIDKVKRILLIEDLASLRAPLKKILSRNNFEVTEASSAEEANSFIKSSQFDIISLDLHLPGENGLVWLNKFRKFDPITPVVILSASDPNQAELIFGALANGAQEFFTKDTLFNDFSSYISILHTLTEKNKKFHVSKNMQSTEIKSKFITNKKTISYHKPEVILIGSSTGGPEVLWKILDQFYKPTPPIVLVQHITSSFVSHFAKTLALKSGLLVSGGKNLEVLKPNTIYMAMDDYHITLKRNLNQQLIIEHSKAEKFNTHRPSVNELFISASKVTTNALAILLTGMGADGAIGMHEISKLSNSITIAQSEESCMVFGMPQEAIKLGAADLVLSPELIRAHLLKVIKEK